MTEYTAGIFIVNDKREILVTHATHSPFTTWGIPKGLVDSDTGETPLQAAIREVYEETGIKILNPDKVHHVGNIKYKSRNKVLVAFYVRLSDLLGSEIEIRGKKEDNSISDVSSYKTIDTSLMTCESMVEPKNEHDKTFPEVDAFKWIDLKKAETQLYQPQREILLLLKRLIA